METLTNPDGGILDRQRYLIVVADDLGMGPETSRGVVAAAAQGLVTGTVLLVNSPHAVNGVDAWRKGHRCAELGWHPCLTLDRPVTPPGRVRSLIDNEGCFYPLGKFLQRLLLGLIRSDEIEVELRAQHARYRELTGQWPTFLNGHHHVHAFGPVSAALQRVLARQKPLPYVRRVREPWTMLTRVPGALLKRAFLSTTGRHTGASLRRAGYPGNDWLAGITDPSCVTDPSYMTRWLTCIPGTVVELACHPGYYDSSLIGRDCSAGDGKLERRVDELRLLRRPDFQEAVHRAGFTLVTPSEMIRRTSIIAPRRAA
ncbi:MAG: ChbG/HpnK family deacetylase [Gemmataceae bacterium]|nr:ChbG/HpnK family deacetylase [Gemmataceae bacterium]